MKTKALFSLALLLLGVASAQQIQPGQKIVPSDLTWPHFFSTNGHDFAVYQPTIGKWPGNQMDGRFVVAVRPAGETGEDEDNLAKEKPWQRFTSRLEE